MCVAVERVCVHVCETVECVTVGVCVCETVECVCVFDCGVCVCM